MTTSQSEFRDLLPNEQAILDHLLEPDFPGRKEIVQQLAGCTVRALGQIGILDFAVPPMAPRVQAQYCVSVESECLDSDGVTIHYLLHIARGAVCELEVCNEDNSAVKQTPAPDMIRVTAPAISDRGAAGGPLLL